MDVCPADVWLSVAAMDAVPTVMPMMVFFDESSR